MIVVMRKGCSELSVQEVKKFVQESGYIPNVKRGVEIPVVAVIGKIELKDKELMKEKLLSMNGVIDVKIISKAFKRVHKEANTENSIIQLNKDLEVGNGTFVVFAGNCAIESRDFCEETAYAVKEAGAHGLRGGAFKPRTDPYSFRGLGIKGLDILSDIAKKLNMPAVTEVMESSQIEEITSRGLMLQVGTRNMQNFDLLSAIGKSGSPVLIKRGMSAHVDEWLLSAEYLLAEGNNNVVLCERGIRSYDDTYTRNVLDMMSAVYVKDNLTHLPVIIDPSHGTGNVGLVRRATIGALAMGLDGVIIEVHPHRKEARCDGSQSLDLVEFADLMSELKGLAPLFGKTI